EQQIEKRGASQIGLDQFDGFELGLAGADQRTAWLLIVRIDARGRADVSEQSILQPGEQSGLYELAIENEAGDVFDQFAGPWHQVDERHGERIVICIFVRSREFPDDGAEHVSERDGEQVADAIIMGKKMLLGAQKAAQ